MTDAEIAIKEQENDRLRDELQLALKRTMVAVSKKNELIKRLVPMMNEINILVKEQGE